LTVEYRKKISIEKINGKIYIGSSSNLGVRLKNYFNISYLENEIKNNNSMIYRALLKNNYSNFILEILEYCDSKYLIKREQYSLTSKLAREIY